MLSLLLSLRGKSLRYECSTNQGKCLHSTSYGILPTKLTRRASCFSSSPLRGSQGFFHEHESSRFCAQLREAVCCQPPSAGLSSPLRSFPAPRLALPRGASAGRPPICLESRW